MLDDVKNTPVTYPESKYPPDGKAPVAFGIPAWLCVPASASPTSPQFRKNLWPLRNHRLELGFWGCRKSFRNWAQGDDIAGGYNKPGVPNISGAVNVDGSYGSGSSGAFYRSGTKDSPNGQNRQASMTYMDASRSNSLYGASTTVMPASVNQPLCLYLGRPS